MKRTSLTFILLLVLGCSAPARVTGPRSSYPAEHPPVEPDLSDKDENPSSQAWPLDRWFVEFETRNGVELKYRQPQFRAALPAHIPVERFIRVVLTAIQTSPKLADMDRASLWNACMRAATPWWW